MFCLYFQLVLDGCSNLGDTELYLLAKEMGQMCEICMRGTNIRYISELEMNKVKVDNCPKFEAQLGKCFYTLQVCYTKYIYLLKPFSHHSRGIFKWNNFCFPVRNYFGNAC